MGWERHLADELDRRTPTLMDATGHFAVLVPIVELAGELHLVYEVRAASLRRQPNEICFPGGRMEAGETPIQTALRETWEELGIAEGDIEVLGESDFVAHRARFILYPVLAKVAEEALERLAMNPSEVEKILVVPVKALALQGERDYRCRLMVQMDDDFPYDQLGISADYPFGVGVEDFPVYEAQGYAIWGLTGRITRHVLRRLGAL